MASLRAGRSGVQGPWQLPTLAASLSLPFARVHEPQTPAANSPGPEPSVTRAPSGGPARSLLGTPGRLGSGTRGCRPSPPAHHGQRRPRGSRPRPPRPPPGPRHTPRPGADPRRAGRALRGRRASGEPLARACGLVGGYITGPGPLQSGARDPQAHAGHRRSPAVDTLGDPVPLQGAAELTAVGVPPLHPPAGGPVPAPRRRCLSTLPLPPARPPRVGPGFYPCGRSHRHGASTGGRGVGRGAPSLLRLRKQRNDNSGARPPRTSQPPAPPPLPRRTARGTNRRRRRAAQGQSWGSLRYHGLLSPPL